jgi:hypothetical protein
MNGLPFYAIWRHLMSVVYPLEPARSSGCIEVLSPPNMPWVLFYLQALYQIRNRCIFSDSEIRIRNFCLIGWTFVPQVNFPTASFGVSTFGLRRGTQILGKPRTWHLYTGPGFKFLGTLICQRHYRFHLTRASGFDRPCP